MTWAYLARQEAMWEQASYLAAWSVKPHLAKGATISPQEINPWQLARQKPAEPRSEEERQAESKVGWELLHRCLGKMRE